jgi:UDP-N-acetylmuramate--alanine ligase
MPKSVDFSGKPFHFIGIGGIGMSAIAHILTERQLPVFGSDLKRSHITERLESQGAHIFWQQDAINFDRWRGETGASDAGSIAAVETNTALLPQVVCSTAINESNAEYCAARELGCEIFHRSDVLAALIAQHDSIAVAGTHGKTTTSSALGYTLMHAGLDPTIVIGGEVNAWGGNARAGHGAHLVAEADESDGSLVKFRAKIGIITNIELDHPDRYTGLAETIEVFKQFERHTDRIVGCIDCPTIREHFQPDVSYSLDRSAGADYSADRIEYGATGTTAQIWERGECLGSLDLKLLGAHNLSNALAVIAVARMLGLEFKAIAAALVEFGGARRRFELRGTIDDIQFIDDYAHHPSEITVTLKAARLRASATTPPRRVVAVFQPHRYSRTQAFFKEFATSLARADIIVLSEIYSAGEAAIAGVSGQDLAAEVAKQAGRPEDVYYRATLEEITILLSQILKMGDFVLFLGAGNLNQIIPDTLEAYRNQHVPSR